ncbi:MAG TPA: transglutaminase-like domain-containing protein [Vicinamibacterales bacterium]
MNGMEDRARQLALLASDEDPESLVRGALLIATIEHHDLDPDPAITQLEVLGREAARRLAGLEALEARVAAVSDYLFNDLGFTGNERRYEDPRNSFLNDVLVRRTGIPISLAIVYIDVARRAGLTCEGVNFPGHFLVRARSTLPGEPDLLVDAFHRGTVLSDVDCRRLLERHAGDVPLAGDALATADRRQIFIRMLTNLKRLYVRSRSFPQALEATHLLSILDDDPIELRDRGLLNYQMRRFPQALHDLELYLQRISPLPSSIDDESREEYEQIWEHVKALRRRIASFN